MCGIVGFFDNKSNKEDNLHIIKKMAQKINHRGPDSDGFWQPEDTGIVFGHKRLAIMDLSPHGHQPMHSSNYRYTCTYNGEIYNFLDIKKDLEHHYNFKGNSDTEVLLAAIQEYGIENTLGKINGMFAFAIWDNQEKSLYLIRDRMGEKPLYYGWNNGVFYFSSEVSALQAHPKFKATIDTDALALYMKHNYVPQPYSIFNKIAKLEPGHILKISDFSKEELPTPKPYWHLSNFKPQHDNSPTSAENDKQVIDNLENKLQKTIQNQMISDVPLGAFLSGGVDSSLVVALMQTQSNSKINSYTIGFSEKEYDESGYAKDVADHLGTNHTTLIVGPNSARDIIPKMGTVYSEPFSDSSQLPTYILSNLTKQHVTVGLSGDGGDELFGGYTRYQMVENILKDFGRFPLPLRKIMKKIILSTKQESWQKLFNIFNPLLPKLYRQGAFGQKLHKAASFIELDNPFLIYAHLISHWHPENPITTDSAIENNFLKQLNEESNFSSFTEKMMYLDSKTYLPDDIMVKVDRAAMAVSLETRTPFLDREILEYVWQLPQKYKVRNNETKWALKKVLDRHVPRKLIERPKKGFGVPIGQWLRNDLRDWAEDLLSENRLREREFYDVKLIRQRWHEHLSGKRNWEYHLWDILMFESWYDQNMR